VIYYHGFEKGKIGFVFAFFFFFKKNVGAKEILCTFAAQFKGILANSNNK
jgi:hypothetical protein